MKANQKSRRRGLVEADRLFNRPWCIRKSSLKALVAEYLSAQAQYGDDDDDEQEENGPGYPITDDGIACIPITGPLTKGYYWRATAYDEVRQMCADAYARPNVKAVLLCVDSPGGEASGMFECSDYLYSRPGDKPMAAISDDQCYSAAYCLASAAEKLFVVKTGGTGSVGCWTAHADMSGMLAQEGVKVTYVYAGEHKVEGNPTEPLSDWAQNEMQQECDRIRDMFVSAVARNRGVSADALYATEAACFPAGKGIPLLADAVGTVGDALNYLRGRIAQKQQSESEVQDAAGAMAGVTVGPGLTGDVGTCTVTQTCIHQDGTVSTRTLIPGLEGLPSLKTEAQSTEVPLPDQTELSAMVAARSGIDCGAGWSDLHYTADVSHAMFGIPDVVFAVRRGAQADISQAEAASTPRRITMLAVPYDGSMANLGGFREVYRPGCFSRGLNNDPRALFNHDEACVLGRKSAGTATFWEDAAGVHVECDAPGTQWADDLLVSMRRGDITQSSAAFWILKQSWEVRGGDKVRVVEEALLREASVYTFPAYENTQAGTITAAQPPAAEIPSDNDYELAFAQLELLRLQ